MTVLFKPAPPWLRAAVLRLAALRATALSAPPRTLRSDRLVTVCVLCTSLCVQIAPDVFEHVGDACKECFGTTGRCAYWQDHGVHEYRLRGTQTRVRCTVPQAAQCTWCHRVLDATELPCPDHAQPCCGCCEPR